MHFTDKGDDTYTFDNFWGFVLLMAVRYPFHFFRSYFYALTGWSLACIFVGVTQGWDYQWAVGQIIALSCVVTICTIISIVDCWDDYKRLKKSGKITKRSSGRLK